MFIESPMSSPTIKNIKRGLQTAWQTSSNNSSTRDSTPMCSNDLVSQAIEILRQDEEESRRRAIQPQGILRRKDSSSAFFDESLNNMLRRMLDEQGDDFIARSVLDRDEEDRISFSPMSSPRRRQSYKSHGLDLLYERSFKPISGLVHPYN